MRRASSNLTCAAFLVLLPAATALALQGSIYNPIENETYGTSSTIATNGGFDTDAQGTVKLIFGGVIQDSATVNAPANGTDWSHDFSQPDGGWAVGDWTCELWGGGNKLDMKAFKVK